MKRVPLIRRTPLPASTKPLKRARLRRIGAKKRKERRDTDGPRRNYRLEFPVCQCCERRRSKHTHEIASGGARANAVYVRAAWLAVCSQCHAEIHETSHWPIARQLYQKWKHDRKFYCRRTVNRLRGRDADAITQAEVDEWATDLNIDIHELRERVEHRQRKLDAARLGVMNKRIIELRERQLSEAKRELAAAIAAQSDSRKDGA